MNGSPPPPQEIETLFIVVVDLDGASRAIIDPDERFVSRRAPSAKDIYPACANIVADFAAMKTAEAVVAMQYQMARLNQSQPVDGESPGMQSEAL